MKDPNTGSTVARSHGEPGGPVFVFLSLFSCFSCRGLSTMLAAADLLQPNGDITAEWFPAMTAEDVTTLLSAYLADGYARIPGGAGLAANDIAVRAWAMARAARNVALRLSNTPATFTMQGEGGQSITGEQIRTFTLMAAKYEAEFAALSASSDDIADEVPSGSADNLYRF